MKVTAITQQVKNKSRYSVFIDDAYGFSLNQDGLLNAGLRVGDELSEAELHALKKESEESKLYDRLLGLLARRPRSRWELQQYLKRKRTAPEVEAKLLLKLEDAKLIDDYDFAQRWVESRRQLKHVSRRKLRQELQQKRISSAVIEDVMAEDETDESSVLRELAEKKVAQSRYRNDKQKLTQYLVRQGFDYGDVKQVVGELFENMD